MAKYVAVVITCPNDSIQTLNDKVSLPTKPFDGVIGVRELLESILAGARAASVQVTTLNSTISVSTDGGQSKQNTYNLL